MNKNIFLAALASLMMWIGSGQAQAQGLAIKTNLLYDATATINAGIEFGLAPRWSMDIPLNYNIWSFPGKDPIYKHAYAQPEVRYWFCDRMAGHFIGIHAHGGAYNVGLIPNQIKLFWNDFSLLTNYRYQGYFAGAGVSYGYAWALSEHLNLEFEIGAGYAYTEYDKFECEECGRKLEEKVPAHYVGPTKAAVNFVVVF
jgi:hypothetical protein